MNEAIKDESQPEALVAEGRARVAAAATSEELRALEAELVGKRSSLAAAKAALAGLEPGERRAAGMALNDARRHIEEAVASRRQELEATERKVRLAAERLDRHPCRRSAPHLHQVLPARPG